MSLGLYKTYRFYNIDIFSKDTTKEKTSEEISDKMEKFGINKEVVELVMLRYIDGWSYKEIIKKTGWTSINSINYHIRNALNTLKKGGFRL